MFPVAETESVVVTDVIPRAEATVPESVPPEIFNLPVASRKAEPPLSCIIVINSLRVVLALTLSSCELNLSE